MMSNPRVNFRTFLVLTVCAAMAGSCGATFGQLDERNENDARQLQILLRTQGLDLIAPEMKGTGSDLEKDQMLPLPDWQARQEDNRRIFLLRKQRAQVAQTNQKSDAKKIHEQLKQQIQFLAQQGHDVQELTELLGKLQHVLETSENANDVAVAMFTVPEQPQQRQEGNPIPTPPTVHAPIEGHPGFTPPMAGRPGFMPTMLMMQHGMKQHEGPGPQFHRPEIHPPTGPFADDQKRIAILKESAERLAQAGLPDAAHGLIERAGQIQRELAEKREQNQREEHERAQSQMREQQEQMHHQPRMMEERQMEQRHQSIGHPALPIHELHEQLQQLRHEMQSINQKVSHLTEMIEHHHRAQKPRGHHEEMDGDDDADDDDADDDDADDDDAGDGDAGDGDADDDDADDDDADDDDADDDDADDDDADDDDADNDDDADVSPLIEQKSVSHCFKQQAITMLSSVSRPHTT